jgi:hypothetical protein
LSGRKSHAKLTGAGQLPPPLPFRKPLALIVQSSTEDSRPLAHALPMNVDLPQARELADLIVRALERLGGQARRNLMIDTALEIGSFSAAQRAEPTHSVSKRQAYPTELHYRLSWAITHAHKNGDIERVEPSVWRLTSG